MVASSLAHTRREVSELLLASFTGRKWWREKVGKTEWLARLDQAIDACAAGGLLTRDAETLHVTDLGRISASKGLEYTAVVELARWANEQRPESPSEIEVLATLSTMRWSRDIHVPLAQKERFRVNYGSELVRRAREAGLGERACFRRFGDADQVLDQETARGIKRTLLLLDWIDEVEVGALERRYRIWSGAIQRVGEEFGWLVECVGGIAQACAWSPARCRWLFQLADRLRFGCRDDALSLARLRLPELGRSGIRRLIDAGIHDVGALRTTQPAALAALLKDEAAANRVCSRLGASAEPARPSSEVAKAESPAPSKVPQMETEGVLRVDLAQRRVWYRGTPVPTRPPNHLQRQPLLALAVLASRPNQIVSMEELADAMHSLGHLPKRPVAPDARELRYKILRPFKKALAQGVAPAELDRLLETVPGVGLRLNLCQVA
jgi:replicative superfamily II helicase